MPRSGRAAKSTSRKHIAVKSIPKARWARLRNSVRVSTTTDLGLPWRTCHEEDIGLQQVDEGGVRASGVEEGRLADAAGTQQEIVALGVEVEMSLDDDDLRLS